MSKSKFYRGAKSHYRARLSSKHSEGAATDRVCRIRMAGLWEHMNGRRLDGDGEYSLMAAGADFMYVHGLQKILGECFAGTDFVGGTDIDEPGRSMIVDFGVAIIPTGTEQSHKRAWVDKEAVNLSPEYHGNNTWVFERRCRILKMTIGHLVGEFVGDDDELQVTGERPYACGAKHWMSPKAAAKAVAACVAKAPHLPAYLKVEVEVVGAGRDRPVWMQRKLSE